MPTLDLPNAELAAGLPDVSHATPGGPERSVAAAPLPEPSLAALPAWDLIDIEKYRRVWRRAHGYFSLNMAASRGCSFRCNWCAKPIWGNQYLQRPAADMAAEMLHLKRHYRPDHIWFADDIFGFKVDWVREFAAALAAAGGGVPFTIQLRADLVSARMATALREAGCREVWIGAESGSQKILDAMNKGTRVRRDRRRAPDPARRRNPRRLLPAARLSRRRARRHPRDAPPRRRGAAGRRRRERRLSTAGHQVLRARQGAARRQAPLAREQRSRNDVPRHLHLGLLPARAQSAARPGDASGSARAREPLERSRSNAKRSSAASARRPS